MIQSLATQVEWRSLSSGEMVAFENGRSLADESDPIGEARSWVELQRKNLGHDPKIIVVGAGSGFHLEALSREFPYSPLIAIDVRTPVTSYLRRRYKNIHFITVNSIEDLFRNPSLQELMKPQNPKLAFKPAFGDQSKIFEEVLYALNIRTYEALAAYLQRDVRGAGHILINLRHLFQEIKPDELPYKVSEVLTLKEIMK
ncbi:MAG: hypothetical protein ACK5Y2_09870 [Bdellovibrionales bacterium]